MTDENQKKKKNRIHNNYSTRNINKIIVTIKYTIHIIFRVIRFGRDKIGLCSNYENAIRVIVGFRTRETRYQKNNNNKARSTCCTRAKKKIFQQQFFLKLLICLSAYGFIVDSVENFVFLPSASHKL